MQYLLICLCITDSCVFITIVDLSAIVRGASLYIMIGTIYKTAKELKPSVVLRQISVQCQFILSVIVDFSATFKNVSFNAEIQKINVTKENRIEFPFPEQNLRYFFSDNKLYHYYNRQYLIAELLAATNEWI